MTERVDAFLAQIDRGSALRRRGLQQPRYRLEGLAAVPWRSARAFPWTRALEQNTDAIRDEFLALGSAPLHAEQALVDAGSWRRFLLIDHGRRDPQRAPRCPGTLALVDAIEGAGEPGYVYFSVLEPGTHVKPHFGPTNLRVRCHLPLVVPEGAELRVGRTTRAWREGRCLLFDDSFEHEARNPSRRARVVLIVDVWHPDLTRAERVALRRGLRERIDARVPPPAHLGAAAAFVNESGARGAREQ